MKRFSPILLSALALFCIWSCEPEVPVINVESVSLSKTSHSMVEGEVFTLSATVSPSNADNKDVSWSSNDATVASVENGMVTALKAGSATITVKTIDGGKTASCNVTVTPKVFPVESVSLDHTSAELTEGEQLTLTATVAPANATNKNVTWSSSDAIVASVENGVVTALKAGSATITVKTEDGAKTANCELVVKSALIVDVEKVSDLSYTMNTQEDQFFVKWTGVENASGYECWHTIAGDSYKVEMEVVDNGDGSWSAKSSTAMGPGTYTVHVLPVPVEGHALKDETPATVEIYLPKFQKVGIIYRFMSDSVEEGVEYETDCYDLKIKYKNIQYLKPDKTQAIAADWYIYTATPVEDIHHLEMWYGIYFDPEKQPIKVYSSTQPGVKEHLLSPDGSIMSGKWKVFYSVPKGHKYIYIQGSSKNNYLLWTSSYICRTASE